MSVEEAVAMYSKPAYPALPSLLGVAADRKLTQ